MAATPQLKRGVNLSSWLANVPRQQLFDNDFKRIKAAGFDHVRIPVDPELFGFLLIEAAGGRVLMDFPPVDQAVALAISNGLNVILDLSPGPGIMTLLENNSRGGEGYIQLWRRVAEHFRIYPESAIAFELLDEPEYYDSPDQYSELMAALVSELRPILQNYIFIIDAPKESTVDGLAALKPISDPNIVYAFHFFDPLVFTHQGFSEPLPDKAIRYLRNVPYPSKMATKTTNYAPIVSDTIDPKPTIAQYIAEDWNADRVAARIKIAADWAAEHHVRIICTAFGALRNRVDPASRYRWIADTRHALDAHGIGWSVWDYTDLFGIVRLIGRTSTEPRDGSVRFANPEEGTREIEADATRALFGQASAATTPAPPKPAPPRAPPAPSTPPQ